MQSEGARGPVSAYGVIEVTAGRAEASSQIAVRAREGEGAFVLLGTTTSLPPTDPLLQRTDSRVTSSRRFHSPMIRLAFSRAMPAIAARSRWRISCAKMIPPSPEFSPSSGEVEENARQAALRIQEA